MKFLQFKSFMYYINNFLLSVEFEIADSNSWSAFAIISFALVTAYLSKYF